MFTTPERTEKFIQLSVCLLKTRNVQFIDSYKNFLRLYKYFLSFTPNPNEMKELFTLVIKQVFETDPKTIYWLLQHPELLQPEVDIRSIVSPILKEKILSLGFREEDFDWEPVSLLEQMYLLKDDNLGIR